MKKISSSQYFKMNWLEKLGYNIFMFICAIPVFFFELGKKACKGVALFVKAIGKELKEFAMIFTKGSVFTKVSYLIMGFGNLCRGQIVRGLFFLAFEVSFVMYQITSGISWMAKLRTLGDIGPHEEYDPILDTYVRVNGDDSFKILLYGGFAVILCLVFIFVWRMNWRQSWENDKLLKAGKKVPKFKEDFHDLVDAKFHKTLLTVPIIGITAFTVLPIIFMIFVAFTNYDGAHDGYSALFTWVGFDNFKELFGTGKAGLGFAFKKIFSWTIVWAILATFSNYFLGMILAIMINKKGIKFKKFWRGIFVLTIAIPQFISLLYMSKLFAKNGLINGFLIKLGMLSTPYDFWGHALSARILVVVINIWIGIPYLMLIATGILMNIPEDLYESAKIDGANAVQQFFKITLPYMLFITGPYLLTSFIGNMGNFNVIFLLGGGATANPALTTSGGTASDVDLLITWLFKITTGTESNYKLASVIGIMIFVIEATISVIGFNAMPSNKNEEDFQ
ncbi:MAG: sugar ABC transporter permease [Lachnospiraceae bacterium]|nr:sugar ABC transporter permease [Lachnospiraceae bacterium]